MRDEGYKILYDSDGEDTFVVQTKYGQLKFERNINNLYILDPMKKLCSSCWKRWKITIDSSQISVEESKMLVVIVVERVS